MKKENSINDKVVSWIENRVRTKYNDDISMVLLYGSYINGTANSRSDVDCYFIPKDDRGYEMAVDFMIDGIGYDLFPMSWDRVENIAALKEVLLPCVGDVQILYYHSEDDLERFRQIQRKLQHNLKNKAYVKGISEERFLSACNLYSEMAAHTDTNTIRKLAGGVIMSLADAVAIFNHDYFHFGLKRQLEDLQTRFLDIPEEFINEYIRVIQSPDHTSCIEHCFTLLTITADYLGLELQIYETAVKEQVISKAKLDFQWLAGLYEEISSTFNKISICCETGNYVLAFLSAVCLQRDLDDAVEYGGEKYRLLDSYFYAELPRLARRAKEIEADYVQRILDGGGRIKSFNSFEEFLKADL